MAMKIKTGDKVKVISGKDKGTEAEVIAAFPNDGKVKVQGVAVVKKHCKPTQANPNGGIIEKEAKIDVSNVMLVCPNCGVPTRVAVDRSTGKRVRVCKKCGKNID